MSQSLTSGGQSIGVSASTSVLPMNTQDWPPLGLTEWISLYSKGLSRVFSNTTVQKHQFFGLSFIFQGHSFIFFLTVIINWQLVYTSHLVRSIQFCSVQSLSHVWLFATPWTAAHQASPSVTNSQSLLKLMSIESVMTSNHLILCHPLLPPSMFPSIRVYSNESALHFKWQSIGVSVTTSVLPVNFLDWYPLGWTGWISLQSKGLSRVFSNTTVQKHQFFGTQPSSGPTLTSIHEHRKNHSLD